jgi:hypothetical protein
MEALFHTINVEKPNRLLRELGAHPNTISQLAQAQANEKVQCPDEQNTPTPSTLAGDKDKEQ